MFRRSALILLFLSWASLAHELPALSDQHDQSIELPARPGHYVVLEWLNFNCHMLRGHYQAMHIQRAQEKLAAMDVEWISVLSDGPGKTGHFKSSKKLKAALALNSWKGKHAVRDEQGIWGKHFAAKKTPYHVVISPEGEIIYRGALDDSNPFTHSEKQLENARNFLALAVEQHRKGEKVAIPHHPSYGCPVRYQD